MSDLGNNHIGSGASYFSAAQVVGAFGPFSVADGGAIGLGYLHVRVAEALGKFRLALYADNGGVPALGALLASSAEGVLSAVGWVSVAMSPFVIVAGVSYWIGVLQYPIWRYWVDAHASGLRGLQARTYANGFPDPYPSGGSNYNEWPPLYISYTPFLASSYVRRRCLREGA